MVHDVSQKSLILKPYEEENIKKIKRAAFTSGKSKIADDARDQEESRVYEEEKVNKFIQYKRFGHNNENIMRVIAVDEVPEAKEVWQVVIKVKVSERLDVLCYKTKICTLKYPKLIPSIQTVSGINYFHERLLYSTWYLA
jgi:hypothetical protein